MKNPITQKMEEGVTSGVFPGGVLLISYKGKVCFHKAFGFAQLIPTKIPLTTDTLFDLASLTKPLATTAAMALLMGSENLHLEDPVSKFIPSYKTGKKREVTLAHLLSHSSGLPDWKPYFEEIVQQDRKSPGLLSSPAAKQKVYQLAHNEKLINQPDTHSLYSDIGFMILGGIIEKVSGGSLDQFCKNNIFKKLNTKKTFFSGVGQEIKGFVAATEDCPWRGKIIRGEVHDDNAYAMGGVSGHAGLFSTAKEVYILVTDWLNSIHGNGIIESALAKRLVTRRRLSQGRSFALGWDTPSLHNSSSGHCFSRQSFGHLGYTGTSIWVDRVNALVVILLTNRVHPTRKNNQIKAFRPALHDLIYRYARNYQTEQRSSPPTLDR
ncbi:MAG: serine hydrolase [Nitrospirae bacterium]|nr:serine hydrolase [Candidatus Troglogloeales bacterium]MBI3598661.1 serine hydrolase [Candidatus Troglogloeales bacterium]